VDVVPQKLFSEVHERDAPATWRRLEPGSDERTTQRSNGVAVARAAARWRGLRERPGIIGWIGALSLALGTISDATLAANEEAAPSPAAPVRAEVPPDSAFQKVTLDDFPGEPIALAVLPDRRVLHTTRAGQVWMHDSATGLNTKVAEIPVYLHDEEGLQGVAIDPKFSRNHWVYLYYSPPLDTPTDDPETLLVNEGDAPRVGDEATWAAYRGVWRLSRFKFRDDALDLASEQTILEIPNDRGVCCHVGGNIEFDRDGNLYVATGDDTDHGADGYAPIDERPDQSPAGDAQRSSANTNDLRGKLLRIKVLDDGSYEIPEGNLFPPGTPRTRPEIYAMGFRNPFRFTVDRETGDIYLADQAPDAPTADPLRGPAATGKWLVIRKPGNYGWPYCATPNLPYVDYDMATGKSGAPFNCQRPINDSPRNTGRRVLPPVLDATVTYSYGPSPRFPELGEGGLSPMAGPAYHYERRNRSPFRWPKQLDGGPLFFDWTRDYVKQFRLARDASVESISPILSSFRFDNPMDMEFGPDGALYVLEYGDGYFSENPGAQLSRIDYVRGNHTPIPVVAADVTNGHIPFDVQFSSAGTSDPDGDALSYAWDFDSDGIIDSREPNPGYTYMRNGAFRASLQVRDTNGRAASAETKILVGNVPPVVRFVTPLDGSAFKFGDQVEYEVEVLDEDPVDCSRVFVYSVLGHDDHGHPLSVNAGCRGTISIFIDEGHSGAATLFGALYASYTDAPSSPDLPRLTSTAQVLLSPSP
jgi:glucose/arabinose dehydrogenase